jgi:hypothetical protein
MDISVIASYKIVEQQFIDANPTMPDQSCLQDMLDQQLIGVELISANEKRLSINRQEDPSPCHIPVVSWARLTATCPQRHRTRYINIPFNIPRNLRL